MDVELRDLLADYSPAIRSWLTELGLETCLDVRHMWQSAAAMESEWSDGPGQSQGADSSLQVASLYAEGRAPIGCHRAEASSRFDYGAPISFCFPGC